MENSQRVVRTSCRPPMPMDSGTSGNKIPPPPKPRDTAGVSLLMQSLYRGRRDLARADREARRKALDIFEAAALGRLDRLKECIRDAAALDSRSLDSRSKDGFTALHFAWFFAQPEAARLPPRKRSSRRRHRRESRRRSLPLHSAASARQPRSRPPAAEHGAPSIVNAPAAERLGPIPAAAQGKMEIAPMVRTETGTEPIPS